MREIAPLVVARETAERLALDEGDIEVDMQVFTGRAIENPDLKAVVIEPGGRERPAQGGVVRS